MELQFGKQTNNQVSSTNQVKIEEENIEVAGDDCSDTDVGKIFWRLVKTLSLHSLSHYYVHIFDRNIHIMYYIMFKNYRPRDDGTLRRV